MTKKKLVKRVIDLSTKLEDGRPRYGRTNTPDEFWDRKEECFISAKVKEEKAEA